MLRDDPPNLRFDHDADIGAACPSLLDLAAYADRRLADDEAARLEVHVAGCELCLTALAGLRADVEAIDEEARLLLVPTTVLDAAMRLREGDSISSLPMAMKPARRASTAPPWIAVARRGAALAACVAIAGAGYRIGDSFTASAPSPEVNLVASGDLFDFGLLDDSDADAFDSEGLFALALTAPEVPAEATP